MSYVDPKAAAKSYRPKAGSMSPGLKRAREPYRLRNAITGLVLGAFTVGIWAWSISAVKQDEFSDIDEEAKELIKARQQASSSPAAASNKETTKGPGIGSGTTGIVRVGGGTTAGMEAVSDRDDAVLDAVSIVNPSVSSSPKVTETANTISPARRGVLQHLDARFPKLLDPKTKTVVWGAPPLDNIGKLSDRIS